MLIYGMENNCTVKMKEFHAYKQKSSSAKCEKNTIILIGTNW
jgi:hypothetical protein